MWNIYIAIMKRMFAQGDKERFFNKFSSRLRGGAKMMTVIEDMIYRKEQRRGKVGCLTDPTYAFLINAKKEFGSGKDISDLFKGWVSSSQIVLIKTGEETGRVVDAFDDCVSLEKDLATISKMVRGALRMPVFSIIGLLFLLNGAYLKGIPLLEDIEPDLSKWGGASTAFYDIVNTFGKEPMITAAWVGAVVVFYVISLPNLSFKSIPSVRTQLNRIVPFFESYRALQASVFLKSFSVLLGSGVRVNTSLELISGNSVKYVRDNVEVMLDKINSGRDMSLMFESDLLGEDGDDLYDMAKSAELEKSLAEIAASSMTTVINTLPVKLDLLGKAMIVLCILVVMLGMGGLFEIVDTVSNN